MAITKEEKVRRTCALLEILDTDELDKHTSITETDQWDEIPPKLVNFLVEIRNNRKETYLKAIKNLEQFRTCNFNSQQDLQKYNDCIEKYMEAKSTYEKMIRISNDYLSTFNKTKNLDDEKITIQLSEAKMLYAVKMNVEKNKDNSVDSNNILENSLPVLEELENFVNANVEDQVKYKEYKDSLSKSGLSPTRSPMPPGGSGPSVGATPSGGAAPPGGSGPSGGATLSGGAASPGGSGPSGGATLSGGAAPTGGTTPTGGQSHAIPSSTFIKEYKNALQIIKDAADSLLEKERLITSCSNIFDGPTQVESDFNKLILLSQAAKTLEMKILEAQRNLIVLEHKEYKTNPVYYAKTDQNLATPIKEMNDSLNNLKPQNDVVDFYKKNVFRINKVVTEINSIDENDPKRKKMEKLIVAFKGNINRRLMQEVHFNQGFQIKQFIEEQEQNNIKIDTINPQQIKQPQPTPKHSPKKQPKASVEKFYEFLGEEIIKLYVKTVKNQNVKNQNDDFATFFTRTIASNFDEFLNSMAQIDPHNIFKEESLDRKGPVKYYWKNSSSNNGPGAEITFTEFAKYFTKSYQKKKTTPEGFTSEFSDISIKLNPDKKRIQTVNRANDTIVNVTLSSITQLSDGSIQNDSLISEDVEKINGQQDMILRKIIIKNALKEKLQEQKLNFSLTSDHAVQNTTTNNNDEKYTIEQNVSEKDNSKIQIKDEKGNLVYVIELSYDEGKTKSKLHM